jgi:hypothetical protein
VSSTFVETIRGLDRGSVEGDDDGKVFARERVAMNVTRYHHCCSSNEY